MLNDKNYCHLWLEEIRVKDNGRKGTSLVLFLRSTCSIQKGEHNGGHAGIASLSLLQQEKRSHHAFRGSGSSDCDTDQPSVSSRKWSHKWRRCPADTYCSSMLSVILHTYNDSLSNSKVCHSRKEHLQRDWHQRGRSGTISIKYITHKVQKK